MQKSLVNTKGVHIFSVCKAISDEALQIQGWIEDIRKRRESLKKSNVRDASLMRQLWDEYNYCINMLHRRFKIREYVIENITTTEGRTALADVLAGVGTYTGEINYTALGTNNAAPAVTDVQLGTETYRKAVSSGTKLGTTAYIETFFTAAEVNGTFEEYGNFIDGTGSANSGQIFNRFTQTVTKSATETLNVQSQITINDA